MNCLDVLETLLGLGDDLRPDELIGLGDACPLARYKHKLVEYDGGRIRPFGTCGVRDGNFLMRWHGEDSGGIAL